MTDVYVYPPIPRDDLTVDDRWIDNVPPCDSGYWARVRYAAKVLQSDGCTYVVDLVVDSCFEHDIHWRTGRTVYGAPITTSQANRRFRKVIEARFAEHDNRAVRTLAKPLGYTIAWGRWIGVTVGSHFIKHQSA